MRDAPTRLEHMSTRARWGLALGCIALGTYPILLATGFVEPAPGQLKAPEWVVGIAGFVFVMLGLFLTLRQSDTLSHVFAATVCLCFAAMGGWVALYAPPGSIAGGIPLLPQSVNQSIGRVVFGLGALLCLAIAAWALRLALRQRTTASD